MSFSLTEAIIDKINRIAEITPIALLLFGTQVLKHLYFGQHGKIELNNICVYGGGGTDYNCVTDLGRPAIIFTDLMGPMPKRHEHVLFVQVDPEGPFHDTGLTNVCMFEADENELYDAVVFKCECHDPHRSTPHAVKALSTGLSKSAATEVVRKYNLKRGTVDGCYITYAEILKHGLYNGTVANTRRSARSFPRRRAARQGSKPARHKPQIGATECGQSRSSSACCSSWW